jgi:hypothetical protein
LYQRDYILRIIEQLGRALLRIRNLILGRQTEAGEVHAELRAIAGRAGLDLELARVLGSELLPMLIAPSGEAEPARCWLFAELLYLEALQAEQGGRTGAARGDLERASEFYALLPAEWAPPQGFPTAAERLAEMRTMLDSAP